MTNQLADNNLNIQDPNLDIKKLELNDIYTGDQEVFNPKKIDLVKKRLSSDNSHGYGILDQGRLIYSTWISTDKIVFKSPVYKIIQISPNQAILEDSYCHPDFRGQGLHSKMNLFRLKKIKEMGFTEAIAIVVKENKPALKTQIKSGFVIKKKLWLVNFFGRAYYIERDLV